MDIQELIRARTVLDKNAHTLHEIIIGKRRFSFFQMTQERPFYPKGVDKNRLPNWIQGMV